MLLLLVLVLAGYYLISSLRSWYRLRHIPGPGLASVSYLWLWRLNRSGRVYYRYRDLAAQYGPLVRVGPNELTCSDVDAVRHMSAARTTYARDAWYLGGRWDPYELSLFNLLDGKAHDALKARTASAYAGRETTALEPGVDEQIGRMLLLLRDKYSADKRLLDFARLSSYLTMDVITKAGLGEAFGYLRGDHDPYGFLDEVRRFWPAMGVQLDIPFIRNLVFSPLFLRFFGAKRTDRTGTGKIMGVGHSIVSKRFGPGAKDEKDMMGSFIRNGLTQRQCEDEALFMIVAGSDTTASVIRVTMLHIIATPHVYQRLKREISMAVRERTVSDPITVEEARAIPYLQAVIYEGIRMRSPAPGLYPKVVPPEGDYLCGMYVPGGTAVGMNTSAILRDAAIFGQDAPIFRPERFLEVTEDRRLEMQRTAELIFGYGRWMCAGKSVALMELNKVFFELLDPTMPWESWSYPVFVEENMWVKVVESELYVEQTEAEHGGSDCDQS